jgi:eukaryotic-like serine/threonine-protein kinase
MSASMTTERWQRLTLIVNDCLELPASAQEAHARALCVGDDALYREAMQWIATAERTKGFLDEPADVEAITGHPIAAEIAKRIDNAMSWSGRRLGAYRITEEVARGGMGSVYKAVRDDDQYKKEVAIKIIHPGTDTGAVVERFKAERQILASLDHPNIARLIDGGTTDDGAPYIVMDYVEGTDIFSYCNQRSLPTDKRLELFRTACSAVHFAHQRLVVHRDLKPNNIMVDTQGQVKLLDFGIAKLLDPSAVGNGGGSHATSLTVNLMTPAYASPEQIKGEAITTASDVYALGVVLYRLLTGKSPYKSDATQPLALAKEIVETDPMRPSTIVTKPDSRRPTEHTIDEEKVSRTLDAKRLRRELRGDLDNIVLMALRKDVARRYSSVEQLSEDVRRYLGDMPISARADKFTYRASKFVVRNRWSVAFAAFAVIGLVGGIVATAHQASVARAAQARAEKHFASVRKLANSYLFDVHDAIMDLPGATPAREMLVKNSMAYLDQLSGETDDVSLRAELATGYDKLADVQGSWQRSSFGDAAGAEASYRKAIAMREQVIAERPQDKETRRVLIVSYGKLSDLLFASNRRDEGLQMTQNAIKHSEILTSAADATPRDALNLARGRFAFAIRKAGTLSNADSASNGSKRDDAGGLQLINAALAELDALARRHPADAVIRRSTTAAFNQVGTLYMKRGQFDQAIPLLTRALELVDISRAASASNALDDRMRLYVKLHLADARLQSHKIDIDTALNEQRDALAAMIALSAADPKSQRYVDDVAFMRRLVADKLHRAGKYGDAIEQLNAVIAMYADVSGGTGSAARSSSSAQRNAALVQQAHVVSSALLANVSRSPGQRRSLCGIATTIPAAIFDDKESGHSEGSVMLPTLDDIAQALRKAREVCSV